MFLNQYKMSSVQNRSSKMSPRLQSVQDLLAIE